MESIAKVSIILCVYNGEAFLREAIDSIISQSYQNIELVIVDDGSTDSTSEIVESYKAQINGIDITYVKQSNLGLTASLNKAISLSSGKYIARHDADDISCPDRISLCVDYFEDNNKHADLLLTNFEMFDETKSHGIFPRLFNKEKIITFNELKYGNSFCHGTFFAKSEIFKAYKYDLDFLKAQDYEFLLRLAANNKKIILLPEVTYRFRVHSKSISRLSSKEQLANAKKSLINNNFSTKYFIEDKSGVYKLILKASRIKDVFMMSL